MTRKTALHKNHIAAGAKMGGFAGYDMPLFYADGVMKEHEWVRSHAGIFDVSHMGQVIIEGQGAAEFFERLTPSAFKTKKSGRAQYTVLTNEDGGIIDDLIVTRLSENKFFAVINAGCKDKDVAWMRKHLPSGLKFDSLDDRGLIALQGPKSESVMREVLKIDLSALGYMQLIEAKLPDGTNIFISRLGYTGEDGFEISIAAEKAPALWEALLKSGDVKPIGLAARDSLRLEMGYCLYGHDIDETTTPIEAGLEWVISKNNSGFIGASKILGQAPARKRVGVMLIDPGVAREGAAIRHKDDEVGKLSSGGHSPTLKKSIGMAYISVPIAETGNAIEVIVRDRAIKAEIVAMPFVPSKTKSMKMKAA